MNLWINLCDFFWKPIVLCGTLYCFITSVRRLPWLLWGEIVDLVSNLHPLDKGGQSKGGQTIPMQGPYSMAPFAHKLSSLHASQTNHSERKYLAYYLVLCPTKHVTI